mgnify:CR=1 FL=1
MTGVQTCALPISGIEGRANFRCSLADTGKNDFFRIAAGFQDARKLAAGNNVKATAQTREYVQHTEVGIGLDRVADQVVAPGEGLVVSSVSVFQCGARVDIAGGAARVCDLFKRQTFNMKLALALREKRHGLAASGDFFASGSAAGALAGGVAPGF